MYNSFFMHLYRAQRAGFTFYNAIKSRGYTNICIYGIGDIGKCVFEEIKGTDLNIICFIDMKAASFNYEYCGIPVISPEHLIGKTNIDSIIVTPFIEYFQIKSNVDMFIECTVISVRDMLAEALSEQEFIDFSDFLVNKGVSLFLFNRPSIAMINNLSLLEQALLKNLTPYSKTDFFKARDFLNLLYGDTKIDDAAAYLCEMRDNTVVIDDNTQTEIVIKNVRSRLINIINGYRYVPDQPQSFESAVYTFGDCSNSNGDDSRTFGNNLQRILNDAFNDKYGVHIYENHLRDISFLLSKIRTLPLNKGDIVIFVNLAFTNCDHNYRFFYDLANIHCYNLVPDFNRPHDYGEVFYDCKHLANKGYKLLADAVFKYISQSGAFDYNDGDSGINKNQETEDTESKTQHESSSITIEGLELYKEYLYENKVDIHGKIGSIVMNCNPFTNGHKYLIEYAASQVELLYIFVVEEDKSFFSFEDRFELVKKGTEHLENVVVLKSGKFIISTVTFQDYFNKDDMPEVEIDASEDVRIFAKEITPTLGISVRFAGTEPLDNITRQYNRDMKRILPQYGIVFEEIARLTQDNSIISASYVRELYKQNRFEEIRNLVPQVTFDFLLRKSEETQNTNKEAQ